MNKIKKGLMDVTPNLEESKARVKKAVLQRERKSKKRHFFPQIVFCCVILLSVILVSTNWHQDDLIQSFSEETLHMYGLLSDGDHTEDYLRDLIIAKYGELKGVKIDKQDIENLIESYKANLPSTFNRVLNEHGITPTAYEKQYLALKAQVELIYDSLLPIYEKMYPQFHEVVYSNLLLFDAMEAVEDGNISLAAAVDIPAIVLYEGENARLLALIEEKPFLEQQLLIMPIRDSLQLNVGENVFLKHSILTSVRTEEGYKQFVVSKDIQSITENKTPVVPAMQKKVNNFIEQRAWQPLTQIEESDLTLQTLGGLYSIWFTDGDIVVSSGEKGFIITKEELQKWAEVWINI